MWALVLHINVWIQRSNLVQPFDHLGPLWCVPCIILKSQSSTKVISGKDFWCPHSLVSGVFRMIGCSRPVKGGPPTNYGWKIGHPKPPFVILKPLNSNYGHYASARNRWVIILKGGLFGHQRGSVCHMGCIEMIHPSLFHLHPCNSLDENHLAEEPPHLSLECRMEKRVDCPIAAVDWFVIFAQLPLPSLVAPLPVTVNSQQPALMVPSGPTSNIA